MVAAQSRSGPYHRTDASVPLHALPPFLDEALARLAAELPDGRPVAYGHVGDGNVHLNVEPPATWDLDRRRALFRAAEEQGAHLRRTRDESAPVRRASDG